MTDFTYLFCFLRKRNRSEFSDFNWTEILKWTDKTFKIYLPLVFKKNLALYLTYIGDIELTELDDCITINNRCQYEHKDVWTSIRNEL